MDKDDLKARAERLKLHCEQVMAGLIPPDAPPMFTLPQPVDDRGLPWWFGPDYHPTPEALEAFGRPPVSRADPEEPESPSPGDAVGEQARP